MRYYYFTFFPPGPQMVIMANVASFAGEFGLDWIHEYIKQKHGGVGIVNGWQEISLLQYVDYKTYTLKVNAKADEKKPILKLVNPPEDEPPKAS